jgi:hypothetical protein
MPTVNEFRIALDGSTTTEYSDGSVVVGDLSGTGASSLPAAQLTTDEVSKTKALVAGQKALRQRLSGALQNGTAVFHAYGNSIVADTSFLGAASGSSTGRFIAGENSGISGFTSAQVLTKLQTEGISPVANVMPLMEGTNDSNATVSAPAHASNLRQAAQFAIDRGVLPIIMMVPPCDLTARLPALKSYYMAEYCLARELGVPVVDPWSRYRDTDGTWTSGASTDQIHPVSTVSHQAGLDLWTAVRTGATPYILPLTNAGEGNGYLLGNVLGLTDTNSDGIPDNWTLTGLTGHTVNPLTDYSYPFRGKKVSITYSQTTAANIQRLSTTPTPVAGDRLLFSGIVGLSTSVNTRVRVYVSFSGTAYGQKHICTLNADSPDAYVQFETVAPAGATQIQLTLRVEPINAGTYSGTLTFGSWDCYNLTTYAV